MTTAEQKTFIVEVIEDIKKGLLRRAEQYPDNWDGAELRWLIRDKFSEVVFPHHDKNSPRKKEYKNEVLINNF